MHNYRSSRNYGYRVIGGSDNRGVLEVDLPKDFPADGGYDHVRLDRVLSEWKDRFPSGIHFRLITGRLMPFTLAPPPFGPGDHVEVVAADPWVLAAWMDCLSGPHDPEGAAA